MSKDHSAGRFAYGFGAIASAGLPWLERMSAAEIVPADYRPGIECAASFLAVLAFAVVAPQLCRGATGFAPLAKRVALSLGVVVLSLAACLAFKSTFGTLVDPNPVLKVAIRLIWKFCYVTMFVAISLAIRIIDMLISTTAQPASLQSEV